ncbi:MAG: nucleotidyltransferase domain-containing protein [Deltaproteobacteria bacterium]|nr:nucleotidyltransferase domain-containing protein [Deltaproteobacteria bacterium]
MIKHQQLPANIESLLPGAADYLADHPRVIFAYLFGGLARGKPRPLTDVDIAVYLQEHADLGEYKLDLLGGLTETLETDEIDLVVLNTAAPLLVMNILMNKKIIVDKEPFVRHRFESLAMRKYFDFSIKEAAILKRRYLRG